MTDRLVDILQVYNGSDGDATKALYAELERLGPAGAVAINLFRAHKSSARAKVYRGGERGRGSYRGMAYDKKQWSMDNLCDVLERHGDELGITWGWSEDDKQGFHRWVLYVEIQTGQVSFHTAYRGKGPDYTRGWDSQRDVGAGRVCAFVATLLATQTGVAA